MSFGYRRLEALLASMPCASATEIADAMRAALVRWQGDRKRRDDVTAVVFRLTAPEVRPAGASGGAGVDALAAEPA